MQLKIAHIINPVKVFPDSDLYTAQPVTFESIEKAKSFTTTVNVQPYAICFPEDLEIVPAGFTLLPFLTRSVLDMNHFCIQRKLPLLCDILNGLTLYSDADYLIYTNADIAVQPYFYEAIAWIIDQGYDAFVVNRRTIDDFYKTVRDLRYMYAQVGEAHPGYDCFVFKKELTSQFYLGSVCIGVNWVGRVLIWNLIAFSDKFGEFRDLHLTFHLGNEKRWKNPDMEDYRDFNKKQANEVFRWLDATRKLELILKENYNHLIIKN